MILRPIALQEADAAVAIARSAWQPIYEGYRKTLGAELFEAVFADWTIRKEDSIRQACRGESGHHVFVAENEGLIAGFICLHIDGRRRHGIIGNNAVAPLFQGRGIARAMYEQAIAWMRTQGVRSVSVTTGADEAHEPARRAYEKAGFGTSLASVTYHRMI